ncbi:MAG: LysM peptidoglycan-binding domain-containing protein [Lentisphaeria bacterium]|jgi:LysM repeat protein
MKRMRILAAMLGLAVAGTGCVTLETPAEREDREQQLTRLQYNVQALLNERAQVAALLTEAREDNSRLDAELGQLARRLDLVERQYATADANYKRQLTDLQGLLAKESQARATAIKEMGSSVSKTMADMLKEQEKRIVQSLIKSTSAAAQGDYIVKRGDNLTLIAQAFNVSIQSLMRANGLTSSNLREGQRLTIPKQ